jgi:SAM-dependent methyltransferase
MFSVKTQEGARKKSSSGQRSAAPSQALQWIWNYLQGAANLRILDCGTVSAATVNLLTQRHAKVYIADMIAPLQRGDPAYWKQAGKQTVFRLDELLKQLPVIPPASLSLIFGWHLLDLVPREHVAELVGVLVSLLKPGGIFYFFLREPNLTHGKDGRWWLESLTSLGAEGEELGKFPYAPLTNREIERLTTGCSLKTFLTRSHRREVVVLKDEEEI